MPFAPFPPSPSPPPSLSHPSPTPQAPGSAHCVPFWVQKIICTGPHLMPRLTMRSLISSSLGLASTWLLFRPRASLAPLQRTSPAAEARGQRLSSRLTGSVCSLHMCTSPPRTRCEELSGMPDNGSYEYTRRQLWKGSQ